MANDSTYGQILRLPKRVRSRPQDADVLTSRHTLTDVFPLGPADPAATGFVSAMISDGVGPILWVQDFNSRRENGCLYTPGLHGFGVTQDILQVTVSAARDVLWAMEEGASCGSLSAVVGEIHGGPAVLDFTATKRLAMRADTSGVPLYLIRSGDAGGLSAARMRWRLGSLPSTAHPHDSLAAGALRWDADLYRARNTATGRWVAQYDPRATTATDRLRLVSRVPDRTLAAGDQPVSDRTRA